MLSQEKINKRQFTCLVILFTIGSSILIVPSGLAAEARQDAWISSLIGVGTGLLLVWLYTTLGSRYPNLTLTQYTEKLLGKYLGKFVSFLFFCFSFLLSSLVLRNIGDFMTTQILYDTPISVIHIIFLIIVIMGVKCGLECFARATEVLLPWAIILFIILVLFITPEFDFKNVQPIFESGIKPILRSAIPFIGTPFLELVVFLMLFPNINRTNEISGAFFKGTLIGGVIMIIVVTISILVLGGDLTARNLFPTYVLGKKLNIGFLERIEVIIAGIWIITVYFKLTISYYISVLALGQVLNLKNYRVLFLPLAMIMVVLALISYPNVSYFQNFVRKIWPFYSLTFGFIYPIVLLIADIFRR